MNRATFKATQCDACGHAFCQHPPEKFYLMAFRPAGADFVVAYAACRNCYPQIPGNTELVARALGRVAARCPKYVEHSTAYLLKHCQAGGVA